MTLRHHYRMRRWQRHWRRWGIAQYDKPATDYQLIRFHRNIAREMP
jgi:hypothetical protein